jgi:ribosomal protein S18 acetylase RimI-like enzyme
MPDTHLLIRLFSQHDLKDVVELSLLAWAPVFQSFEQILGAQIYSAIYPQWQGQQKDVVERVCQDRDRFTVWVAQIGGAVAGFIAYALSDEDHTGEVELLAVHPDYQNQGLGTELNTFALARMKERGMRLAVVGTGGDPGHAPARRSYEKAGYTALPLVRYYKSL